ncbi:DUF1642 domain-containing protein [Lactococcus lactis]|uniref:DUF1642 domain-containing protein n=1 Tax=Lactococcus lactis TaxID=1358 RepID=UPI002073D6AC|nr:DUF1642 domain-containing protein [Lactococcus lactis]MCM6841308.1 DUF1642 domain-containing protein [Lactococcus lactis]MCM6849950.1 DUF1642 domain-containing protein [Lactococcus lactis]MCM6852372.1 DUF1642 domain-containing protein [Lactococcus lactis]MCM6857712.1 DUF1642 domain-containing protein [Lactococcus lactis]
MTKEMKRPISNITQDSIKPLLSNAVEFYTNKNREAHKCIQERDEYINYLESKLSNAKPQQALPVVPECVAGAIESIPDHYSAFEAIDLIKSKVEVFTEENKYWLQVYNWLCEGIDNQDTFALAFITGKYEVEKPQLFYIDLPKVFGLSDSTSDSTFVSKAESGIISEFTKGKDYALKLTEQEIKSIDERYWQFAVPVEDGE